MHPRLGSATLSHLNFPGKSNPNFPWEESQWDNTVITRKEKKKKQAEGRWDRQTQREGAEKTDIWTKTDKHRERGGGVETDRQRRNREREKEREGEREHSVLIHSLLIHITVHTTSSTEQAYLECRFLALTIVPYSHGSTSFLPYYSARLHIAPYPRPHPIPVLHTVFALSGQPT